MRVGRLLYSTWVKRWCVLPIPYGGYLKHLNLSATVVLPISRASPFWLNLGFWQRHV